MGLLAIVLAMLVPFILPIGGGVGTSLLLVGLTRRWWAGFLAVPFVTYLLRSVLDFHWGMLTMPLVVSVLTSLACILWSRDPGSALLSQRARRAALAAAGFFLGVATLATGAVILWFANLGD